MPSCERVGKAEADQRLCRHRSVARKKFPGQRASLDALCERFGIDNSSRTKHGALLEFGAAGRGLSRAERRPAARPRPRARDRGARGRRAGAGGGRASSAPARPHAPSAAELAAHAAFLKQAQRSALAEGLSHAAPDPGRSGRFPSGRLPAAAAAQDRRARSRRKAASTCRRPGPALATTPPSRPGDEVRPADPGRGRPRSAPARPPANALTEREKQAIAQLGSGGGGAELRRAAARPAAAARDRRQARDAVGLRAAAARVGARGAREAERHRVARRRSNGPSRWPPPSR